LSREAKVEEEFYRLTKNVLEKREYTIEGMKFGDPEPQYPVDSGTADLMIPTPTKRLFIVEFKRKIQTPSGLKILRETDPLGSKVITQALVYAVQCGASFFATTNGKVFALFTTPERGDAFRIDRHRLLVKEIQLTEDAIEEILRVVARWHQGIKIERTPLDWTFIIRLRSFVEWLSIQMLPLVERKLETDTSFKRRYIEFSKEVSRITPEAYSREAAYILMNRIVFYRILERYYGNLPILKSIASKNGTEFLLNLLTHFEKAMECTKDFEPVFEAGLYDEAPLPDNLDMLEEINAFIDDMGTYRLEEIGSDVIGFIYERLIPDVERHELGQFYTPPQIAELIVKWAVRKSTDSVMDPACGSGTFLVKAYGRLRDLKPLAQDSSHKEILRQLYAIDINSFPAHITAVNLGMRDVRHPTSEMNVVVEDFFKIMPEQKVLAPYTIKTSEGEFRREILIPLVDAVVANPPYTRWTELPDSTRAAVMAVIGSTIRRYKITAGMVRSEPMVYVHFLMHGSNFLENGGRLAMIVSNSWLQTEYGVKLGAFMLDHFKVKAVIDFATRFFPIPLVATTVILLEKETDQAAREKNDVTFLYVDSQVEVTEILNAVHERDKKTTNMLKNVVPQGEIDRNKKWIGAFFGGQRIEKLIKSSKHVTSLKELFVPLRGNTKWAKWAVEHGSRLDLGANDFFYLDKATVEQWGLQNYVVPALTSARYSKNFSFLKSDWQRLRDRGAKAFLFSPGKPKSGLPRRVQEYIEWGEKKCRTRAGKLAPESEACIRRADERTRFKGWYDIGGIVSVPIFGTYYVQYRHRFGLSTFPVALDTGILAYIPKKKMTQKQLKATAAYLNSTFFRLMVETEGNSTGGGMIELEMSQAEKLPVIDATRLPHRMIEQLSGLFNELETESRKFGGADTEEKLEKLGPFFLRIDQSLAKLFGFDAKLIEETKSISDLLKERRIARAEEAKPEAIRGEEKPRIRPPKRTVRQISKEDRLTQPLERWLRH
jgi:type I restriction-modification system DNA methylase subunit